MTPLKLKPRPMRLRPSRMNKIVRRIMIFFPFVFFYIFFPQQIPPTFLLCDFATYFLHLFTTRTFLLLLSQVYPLYFPRSILLNDVTNMGTQRKLCLAQSLQRFVRVLRTVSARTRTNCSQCVPPFCFVFFVILFLCVLFFVPHAEHSAKTKKIFRYCAETTKQQRATNKTAETRKKTESSTHAHHSHSLSHTHPTHSANPR